MANKPEGITGHTDDQITDSRIEQKESQDTDRNLLTKPAYN